MYGFVPYLQLTFVLDEFCLKSTNENFDNNNNINDPVTAQRTCSISKCKILEPTCIRNTTKISLTGVNIASGLAKSSFVAFPSAFYASSNCNASVVLFTCVRFNKTYSN